MYVVNLHGLTALLAIGDVVRLSNGVGWWLKQLWAQKQTSGIFHVIRKDVMVDRKIK